MMLSKEEKNKIKELIAREALMDVTFHTNGFITAKKKFKALSGRSSKMYADKIGQVVPNAKIETHEIKNDSVVVKFSILSS